jgi:chromosomal replication initiation ATPase DnaA
VIARPTPQLPLALRHEPDFGRDSFMAGPSNSAALALVEAWPNWPAAVVILSGPGGSGKTHLAHIWAERSGAEFLDGARLAGSAPAGLPRRGLVLEDIDPDNVPEQALFHLINSAKEAGIDLLITSARPAQDWQVALPDLRSRLRLAAPAVLMHPDEDLLRRALVKLFADRQLVIDKPVLDYLLARMERSLAAAVEVVSAVDREALASGRPITRRLAAAVLPSVAENAGEFTGPQ